MVGYPLKSQGFNTQKGGAPKGNKLDIHLKVKASTPGAHLMVAQVWLDIHLKVKASTPFWLHEPEKR